MQSNLNSRLDRQNGVRVVVGNELCQRKSAYNLGLYYTLMRQPPSLINVLCVAVNESWEVINTVCLVIPHIIVYR